MDGDGRGTLRQEVPLLIQAAGCDTSWERRLWAYGRHGSVMGCEVLSLSTCE